ncbi:Fic family toxin-antitoxin system, toxin component OS=Streptomyces alboniger OX=132473 GN=CP975_01855 PE=4 SV=1 [Streptomyces alboniger]
MKIAAEPLNLRIDLAWLLMIAEHKTPGDPAGHRLGRPRSPPSARHEAEIFGVPVYETPHDRAAARRPILLHIPALERSNALFAASVAYAYLVSSGTKVVTSPEQVRDLARLVKEDGADVHAIAEELRRWSL